MLIGIDTMVSMMPEKNNLWDKATNKEFQGFYWEKFQEHDGTVLHNIKRGDFGKKIGYLFRELVKTMVKSINKLIIDEVCLELDDLKKWQKALKPFNVKYMGFDINRKVLLAREQGRKDH